MQPRHKIGRSWILRFCAAVLLVGQVWLHLLQGKVYHRQIMEQMVIAGPGSILPAFLVNFFAGMIFTIQTARELVKFGAENTVGGAFALAFCRELAPILTASIIAGQVGSAFAAELAEMQVTEQIDALYMLKTDPIDYLVLPRVIACCVMVPVITILALVIGVIGGVFVGFYFYQVTPEVFLESVRDFLGISDILTVLLKGLIFGMMVAVIGCSWGLSTVGGAKQVGESATAAVVTTWVAIFMVDFFLSLLIFEKPAI
ncbi:transporter [Calothrix sp. 336/3]|nr:transporter [Calothrix sp. 336/3]